MAGLLLAASAAAQCVSSERAAQRHVGFAAVPAIQLVPNGIPARLMDVFRSAYGGWNAPGCNILVDAGAGVREFPYLQETADRAGRTVTVQFHRGMNPRNNQSCGNLSGNTVNLYEQGRRNNGYAMKCDVPVIFRDTVTHELGHLLGLQDEYGIECHGHAMSQAVFTASGHYVDRSLRSGDCTLVAEINDIFPEDLDDAVKNRAGEAGSDGTAGGYRAAEGP